MKSEGIPLPLYLGTPPQPSDLSSHTPSSGNISLALNAKPPGYVSHGISLCNLYLHSWCPSAKHELRENKEQVGFVHHHTLNNS